MNGKNIIHSKLVMCIAYSMIHINEINRFHILHPLLPPFARKELFCNFYNAQKKGKVLRVMHKSIYSG